MAAVCLSRAVQHSWKGLWRGAGGGEGNFAKRESSSPRPPSFLIHQRAQTQLELREVFKIHDSHRIPLPPHCLLQARLFSFLLRHHHPPAITILPPAPQESCHQPQPAPELCTQANPAPCAWSCCCRGQRSVPAGVQCSAAAS